MLKTELYTSISCIDESLWNSIVSPNEVFNTHQFIHVVEKAKVENASFWYLLFYNDKELIGHSVLSCYTIALDLFIPNSKIAGLIRKIFPNFFNVKILFSGLPASFGQLNLKIINEGWHGVVTNALSVEMEKLAAHEKVSLLCVKEFKQTEIEWCRALVQHKYFQAFSLPYMAFEIKWDTFQEYLSCLRHPYRRAIKLSFKKFNWQEPVIYSSNDVSHIDSKPILVLGDKSLCTPAQMHALYLSVMERTPTKLEILNQSFFDNFYAQFGEILEVLTVQHRGKVMSAALLIPIGEELTFMLVGRENDKDDVDSYFNLVYGIIQLGIQRRMKTIKMGQTAYWVKQRVGAVPILVYFFFKSRKPLTNWLLTKFSRLIFPELALKPIKAIKGQEFTQEAGLTDNVEIYE